MTRNIENRLRIAEKRARSTASTRHSQSSSLFRGSSNFRESELSASTLADSPPRFRQSVSIDEEKKTDEKARLSQILLKHSKELKLKTVAKVVKENTRQSSRYNHHLHDTSTQATDAAIEERIETEFNEKKWKSINLMVKEVTI